MDQFERTARRAIPNGYYVISSGPLRGDDLLYVWPEGGFARADASDWLYSITDAADAFLALRRASFDDSGYTSRRTYTMPARNAG